jgi:hypothetical protein
MQLPQSDHVIYKILRLAVVGVIMVVMLKFNYLNGWSPADYLTLIATLMALGGFDAIKAMTAPK